MSANRRDTWPLVILVSLAGVLAFLPALRGEWIYDDHLLIERNAYVHSFEHWTHWLTSDFWDVSAEARATPHLLYWRPLVSATYTLDWQLGGGVPLPFHITNLVLHALVITAGFFVLRRWVGTGGLPAALAILIFAVHPSKAESVAWISGRTDELCMLLALIATTGMAMRLRGARSGLAIEVAGTLGAYFSKEQAIVLPLFAAVEAWVFAGRPALDLRVLSTLARRALPQLAVALGYLVVRAIVLPVAVSVEMPKPGLVDRVQIVLETFGRFIHLTLVPTESSLQHGLVMLRETGMVHSAPHILLGVFGLSGLTATAWLVRRRWPLVTVGIGFYLLALLPTSNVRYSEMETLVSERFLYLPLLGAAAIVAGGLASVPARFRRHAVSVVAACTLALSALTLSRSTDFVSERELWAHELELHPESLTALHFQLRTAFAEKRLRDALSILLRIQQTRGEHGTVGTTALEFAHDVALVLSHLTPDRDVASLRAIDEFCRAVLEPSAAVARLDVRGVRLAFPPPQPTRRDELRRAQLYALRAELHSRLGDDARALELVADARRSCPPCETFVVMDALSRARASRFAEALELLNGIARTSGDPRIAGTREKVLAAQRHASSGDPRARARQYAALELWGRAFDAITAGTDGTPSREQALAYAELAFRAGERSIATNVLRGQLAQEQLAAQLDEWEMAMGWAE